jgi:hypothetical protein
MLYPLSYEGNGTKHSSRADHGTRLPKAALVEPACLDADRLRWALWRTRPCLWLTMILSSRSSSK